MVQPSVGPSQVSTNSPCCFSVSYRRPGVEGDRQRWSCHLCCPLQQLIFIHFLQKLLALFLNLIFQLLFYLHSSCFNETKMCLFPLLELPGEFQYKTNKLAFKIKFLWVAFPHLMGGTKGWSKTN